VLGGKFPHSQSFVPGGITFKPTSSDLVRVSCILLEVENMVTQKVLGCSVARWLANKSLANVLHWLEEKSHASSDLGLFIRIGKDFGLHKLGAGPGTFLSYGGFIQPDGKNWLKPGFFDKKLQKFDETKISEHVKYSWYEDYAGGKHPKEGETRPFYTKSRKYSFIKSPRYSGKAVEVGPLARQVINKDRLISDLAKKLGPSVYTRELARMHEAVKILQKIREWIDLVDPVKPFYKKPSKKPAGFGAGLTEAPRGALGHWVEVDKKIKRYQIITPTAWNASPADSDENPGPMEQAAISTEVTDKKNPVEVEHVIRSFDPCVGCAVHVISLK
jgi:hydrogenase large subunit